MVNYALTKIYKIETISGESLCYVGSTTKKYLSQRMDSHRSGYKQWLKNKKRDFIRSYKLFEEFGIENCNIILLASYPCNTIDERKAREGYYIKLLDCVNKNIAGRTGKEWYKENKEKTLDQQKGYRDNNKEKISDHMKEYYQVNKEKMRSKYDCLCGSKYSYDNKSQHFKTKKHLKYLQEHPDYKDPVTTPSSDDYDLSCFISISSKDKEEAIDI